MIEFLVGVCVGYFCRPVVAFVISFISDAWKKYQQGKSDSTNTPK